MSAGYDRSYLPPLPVLSVRTVVRKNNHSFVIEIDRAEMLKEIDSGG